jgi:hypothetical protein
VEYASRERRFESAEPFLAVRTQGGPRREIHRRNIRPRGTPQAAGRARSTNPACDESRDQVTSSKRPVLKTESAPSHPHEGSVPPSEVGSDTGILIDGGVPPPSRDFSMRSHGWCTTRLRVFASVLYARVSGF